MTDFGTDSLVFPTVDVTFAPVSGTAMLADALGRRLLTPKGTLTFHPDYGLDLRSYVNETITDTTLFELKAEVETELEQDERVSSVSALATFDAPSGTLSVSASGQGAEGPFALVANVSALSVSVIAEQG